MRPEHQRTRQPSRPARFSRPPAVTPGSPALTGPTAFRCARLAGSHHEAIPPQIFPRPTHWPQKFRSATTVTQNHLGPDGARRPPLMRAMAPYRLHALHARDAQIPPPRLDETNTNHASTRVVLSDLMNSPARPATSRDKAPAGRRAGSVSRWHDLCFPQAPWVEQLADHEVASLPRPARAHLAHRADALLPRNPLLSRPCPRRQNRILWAALIKDRRDAPSRTESAGSMWREADR